MAQDCGAVGILGEHIDGVTDRKVSDCNQDRSERRNEGAGGMNAIICMYFPQGD